MGSCNRIMRAFAASACLTAAFASLLCVCRDVAADEDQILTLWSRVPAMERVSRSYVVASDTTKVIAVAPLTYLEPPQGKEATILGRLRLGSQQTSLRLLFAMMNSEGEVRSVFRDVKPEDLPMTARLSTNQLRDRFVERRGALRQLQASLGALETRLATLQEDADAIANVNKLVNAEDELQELKASLERARLAQASIQSRVALLRSRPQPLNAQRRQADLVLQLGDFSTALTKTESGAFKRMRSASSDLQSKLKDIEETREEHVGLLEEELAQVKRGGLKSSPH